MLTKTLKTATILAAIGAFSTLSATPVTFASFVQQSQGSTRPFQYSNVSGANPFSATNVPVFFTFDMNSITGGLDPALQGFQNARLTLSSTTTSTRAVNGTELVQPGFMGSLSIRRATPFNGLDNLLTVTFTASEIRGQQGNFSAGFTGSAFAINPNDVIFTSDFLTFDNSIGSGRAFSLGLSAILTSGTTVPAGGQGVQTGSNTPNTQLATFRSNASGLFDAEPRPTGDVPEPATMALMGSGLIGLVVYQQRRRRA